MNLWTMKRFMETGIYGTSAPLMPPRNGAIYKYVYDYDYDYEIGPHVFEKSGRQTHRQTDAAALYN